MTTLASTAVPATTSLAAETTEVIDGALDFGARQGRHGLRWYRHREPAFCDDLDLGRRRNKLDHAASEHDIQRGAGFEPGGVPDGPREDDSAGSIHGRAYGMTHAMYRTVGGATKQPEKADASSATGNLAGCRGFRP